MSDLTEDGLRAELDAIRAEQREHQAALTRLYARSERIEGILAGPRVIPTLGVWRHHSYDEDEVESIEDGMRMAEAISDMGNGAPVGVFVGGAFVPLREDYRRLSEADVARILDEHRRWEALERKEEGR